MKDTTNLFHNTGRCLRPRSRRRKQANTRPAWFLSTICAVFLAASASAQQADTVPTEPTGPKAAQQTNGPAINVEETDSNKESKPGEWDWDWDSETKGSHGVRREAVVAIWNDAELRAEDRSEAVVAIGGSAT